MKVYGLLQEKTSRIKEDWAVVDHHQRGKPGKVGNGRGRWGTVGDGWGRLGKAGDCGERQGRVGEGRGPSSYLPGLVVIFDLTQVSAAGLRDSLPRDQVPHHHRGRADFWKETETWP